MLSCLTLIRSLIVYLNFFKYYIRLSLIYYNKMKNKLFIIFSSSHFWMNERFCYDVNHISIIILVICAYMIIKEIFKASHLQFKPFFRYLQKRDVQSCRFLKSRIVRHLHTLFSSKTRWIERQSIENVVEISLGNWFSKYRSKSFMLT